MDPEIPTFDCMEVSTGPGTRVGVRGPGELPEGEVDMRVRTDVDAA